MHFTNERGILILAELKTKPTAASVTAFIAGIKDESRRADCRALARMMKLATGATPKMWGSSMVGFGKYRYSNSSGRGGEWFLTGFSPRSQSLTIYIMAGFDRYKTLMAGLGRHKTGKSCLYIRTLADVDLDALKQLIGESVQHMKRSNRPG